MASADTTVAGSASRTWTATRLASSPPSRAGSGAACGPIGEGAQPGEAACLGVRQRQGAAPLGAVTAGDEQGFGEPEAGEVLDVAPDTMPTGVRADRSPRASSRPGAVPRRRRGRRSARARRRRRRRRAAGGTAPRPRWRRRRDRRQVGPASVTSRPRAMFEGAAGEVGEKAIGPAARVATGDGVAQCCHPARPLGVVHLDGVDDGTAHRGVVVGVDEHGVGELVGGAGELPQHEHAVHVARRGDVLLGDEVHPVAQRGHQHHVGRRGRGRRARSSCSAPVQVVDGRVADAWRSRR